MLYHGLQVALIQQSHAAALVGGGPVVGLAGKGDGGLQGDLRVALPEVQNRLAEIQVGSLGHAAQEVAEALAVGLLQGLVQPGFQGQAPGASLRPQGSRTGRWPEKQQVTAGSKGMPPFRGLWGLFSLWYNWDCQKSTKIPAKI